MKTIQNHAIKHARTVLLASVISALFVPAAWADDLQYSNKLLLTGGVSQVEGAAGGGLTPWALIGGYGTNNEVGGNVHYTYVKTGDYNLKDRKSVV